MATSSILGAERAPSNPKGRDVDSLGLSDSSDSGSDSLGVFGAAAGSDTDREGTGERPAAEPGAKRQNRDITPDRTTADPEGEAADAKGDVPPEPRGR